MVERDLSELNPETHDVQACWRKVSAGGEMKTAIKRLLDDVERYYPNNRHYLDGHSLARPIRVRLRALKKAMEQFTNV